MKKNLVKSKAMLGLLETAIKKYQNILLSASQIIEELIKLASEVREPDKEGERLRLTEGRGSDISRETSEKVRNNTPIDWPIRESSRTKLMVSVGRWQNTGILRTNKPKRSRRL